MKIEGLKAELQKELQNIESLIEMKSRRSGEKGIMLVFEYQRVLSRLRKVIQEEQISDSPTMILNDLRAALQSGFPPEYDEQKLRKKWDALTDNVKAEIMSTYGMIPTIHSQVVQQPSGAVIKLKSREHAISFIAEKQVKCPVSRCIFWLNGDITIDLYEGKSSFSGSGYKGFFNFKG